MSALVAFALGCCLTSIVACVVARVAVSRRRRDPAYVRGLQDGLWHGHEMTCKQVGIEPVKRVEL